MQLLTEIRQIFQAKVVASIYSQTYRFRMFRCFYIGCNGIFRILRVPNGIVFRVKLNAVCTDLLCTIDEIEVGFDKYTRANTCCFECSDDL